MRWLLVFAVVFMVRLPRGQRPGSPQLANRMIRPCRRALPASALPTALALARLVPGLRLRSQPPPQAHGRVPVLDEHGLRLIQLGGAVLDSSQPAENG